jgi:hypothetical protein
MKYRTFITLASFLIILSSCAPAPDQELPKETEVPEAILATETTPAILSMHYIEAAAALAADDMEKAKVSLSALAKDSKGEMKELAEKAASTGDIAAMRDNFKELSKLATTIELPEGYAVAFCPMYKGGAKWVQKKETLANPYFGKTMMTCGSFVN